MLSDAAPATEIHQTGSPISATRSDRLSARPHAEIGKTPPSPGKSKDLARFTPQRLQSPPEVYFTKPPEPHHDREAIEFKLWRLKADEYGINFKDTGRQKMWWTSSRATSARRKWKLAGTCCSPARQRQRQSNFGRP